MKKVGIIGCGGIAQVHGWVLQSMENAELTAVCDIEEDRATTLSVRYGEGNAKVYTNWQALCKSNVDAVHICTPHYLHVPMAVELQGEQGRITVNGSEVTLWTTAGGTEHFSYERSDGIGKGYWGCGHQACILDFYRCLEEGKRFQGDVEGVMNTFETMMSIYEKGRCSL